MAPFLAAPLFRRYTQPIRLTVTAIYCAALIGLRIGRSRTAGPEGQALAA